MKITKIYEEDANGLSEWKVRKRMADLKQFREKANEKRRRFFKIEFVLQLRVHKNQ